MFALNTMSVERPPASEMRLLEEDEFSEYIKDHMSVPKYDSSREAKIPNAYWDLDTERISSILRQMEIRFGQMIQNFPNSDKELHHLLAQLHKIPHYERKKATTIGLIGAQGHGKSMLINALFELEGISLTGKLGGALTCTVVKYQYSSNSRSSTSLAYNGEIQFLDEKRIGEMIREHVKDYAHYHDDGEDSEDDGAPGVRDFKQDDADRKRRDTAMEVFETLFGSKEDFLEGWAQAESKNDFVRICQIKCKDIIREHKVDDQNVARKDGNTPHDLLLKLKQFLVNEKGLQQLWPLVDYVTVRLDHELLKNGAIVIDVPGTDFWVWYRFLTSLTRCRNRRLKHIKGSPCRGNQRKCKYSAGRWKHRQNQNSRINTRYRKELHPQPRLQQCEARRHTD